MANTFEDGTVVQLKSGGPLMTVEGYNRDTDRFICEWFVDGKKYRELFKGTSLEAYVDESPY